MIGNSPFLGAGTLPSLRFSYFPLTKGLLVSALPQFGIGLSPDSEPVPPGPGTVSYTVRPRLVDIVPFTGFCYRRQ